MKRLLFLIWCLLSASILQAQLFKNVPKDFKGVILSGPERIRKGMQFPLTVHIKASDRAITVQGSGDGLKVHSIAMDLLKQEPRTIISVGLPKSANGNFLVVDNPRKEITVGRDTTLFWLCEVTRRFPRTKSGFSVEISTINGTRSIPIGYIPIEVESDVVPSDEAYVESAKKKQGRTKDFFWKDSVTFENCINDFKDFLNQFNRNVNEELTVTTIYKNKVNQALFAFVNQWKDKRDVQDFNAPTCVRFLEQCDIKFECQTDTYTNWLRGAYKKWETRGEEHYDHAIDSIVNDRFIKHQSLQ